MLLVKIYSPVINYNVAATDVTKKLDPFTFTKPKKKVKNRSMKSFLNKCEKKWDSSYVNTTSKALRHKEACDALSLSTDFTLNDECDHNKEINEGKLCNSIKSSQSKPYQKPSSKIPHKRSNHKSSAKPPSKTNNDSCSQSKFPHTYVFQEITEEICGLADLVHAKACNHFC